MAEEQQSNLPILAGLRDVADSHTNATSSLNSNISRGLRNVVGSITNLQDSFLNLSTRQMNSLEEQVLGQQDYFERSLEQQKAAASGPLQLLQTLFGFISQNQATKIAELERERNAQEAEFKKVLNRTIGVSEKITKVLAQQTTVFAQLKDNFAKMIALSGQQTVMMAKQRQDYLMGKAGQLKSDEWRDMIGVVKSRYVEKGETISEEEKSILKGDTFLSGMLSLQKVIWDVKDLVGQGIRKQNNNKETAAKLSSEAQNTAAVKQNTAVVKDNTEKQDKTDSNLRNIFGKNGSLHKSLKKFVEDMSQGASGLGTWLLGFGKSMLRWMPMLAAFGSSAIDYFGAQGAKESRKQHWMSQGYSEEEATRLGQAGTEGYGSSFGTLAGAGIGMLFGGPIGSAIGAVAGNYIGKLLTGPDSIGEKLEKFVIDWGKENDKILQREENLVDKEEILQMEQQPWWRDVLNSLGFGPAMNQIDENRKRALENAKRKRDADAIDQNERALRDSEILARKAREDKAFREALEATKNNPEQMKAVIEQYKKMKEQPSSLEMNKKTDGALLNEKGSLDNKVIVVPAPAQQSSAPVTNNITNNTTKISMGTDPNFKARVTPEYNSYGRPALA